MERDEYPTMREVEDEYWWYRVLRGLALRALKKRCPTEAMILDAGCGTGGMLSALKAARPQWTLHGIDLEPLAVEYCRGRALANVARANVARMPFDDATFDVVLCLDVLYHAAVDQAAALAEIKRVLRPGGILVLNLPAFDCLRGSHDVAVCGARRYTSCHVRDLLRTHSLQPEMIQYWNAWLFLPLLLRRLWSRRAVDREQSPPASDLKPLPVWANKLVRLVGIGDSFLCRWIAIPFGTSVFAVATKHER